jgi:hypothetical protein
MKFHPKRAVAVAAAVIMGFGTLIAAGPAQAASASNYAHSSATAWHHNSFDVAFQVRQMNSDSINAYNDAEATSSKCNGCRSVAIAFQIVADSRVADYVNAGNYASAVNYQCDNCHTLGIAYQFVMAKPTVLDWYDRGRLYRVEHDLMMLRWSTASVDSVARQVESLAGQVVSILAHAGSHSGYWPIVHRYISLHH